MNKAFPLIIWIIALGIFLYTLPEFAAYFGFQSLDQSRPSAVVLISENYGKVFNKTYWPSKFSSTVYDFEIDHRDSSFIYAATDQGLFISRDGGNHWYGYSDLEGQLAGATVYQIEKAANNPGRLFVSLFKNGQGEIYETQDRFFTLKKVFDVKDEAVYKLISSAAKLYLGLSDGRLISYSLENSGFSLLAAVGSAITDITLDGSKIYVATKAKEIWEGSASGQGFFVRQERPLSQSAYTASLLSANLKTVVAKEPIKFIVPDSQGQIYLAASDKLYRSSNQGKNWQLLLDVPGRQVNSLSLATNGKIIVGTAQE